MEPNGRLLEDYKVERIRKSRPEDVAEAIDNVLRLGLASKEQGAAIPQRGGRNKRDWGAALDAVHQAAEVMRATEDHAKEVEGRSVSLVERALKELKVAENRLQAAEAATRAAEVRAREAEARLVEAEDWMMRLQEAINDHLLAAGPPSARRSAA
jgi:hypothetical protein